MGFKNAHEEVFNKYLKKYEKELDKYFEKDYFNVHDRQKWKWFCVTNIETKEIYRFSDQKVIFKGDKFQVSPSTVRRTKVEIGYRYISISEALFNCIRFASQSEDYERLEEITSKAMSKLNREWVRFKYKNSNKNLYGLVPSLAVYNLGYFVCLYLFLLIVQEKYEETIEALVNLSSYPGIFKDFQTESYAETLKKYMLLITGDADDYILPGLYMRYFAAFASFKNGKGSRYQLVGDFNSGFVPKVSSKPPHYDPDNPRISYLFPKDKVELKTVGEILTLNK